MDSHVTSSDSSGQQKSVNKSVSENPPPQDGRHYESYQGREAYNIRGSVNSEIPTHNAGTEGEGDALKINVRVLAKSLSPLAFCWGWFGLIIIGGALTMIALAFVHSKSDYELAIGLMIGGVFCLLMGVMSITKGSVTCYRTYRERISTQSTNQTTPLLH